MISLILAVLVLGLIIVFHELGHFLLARLFSVSVVSFSLGMGPRLWSHVSGNTEYCIRAIPFGGSCLMAGEELQDEDADSNIQREPDGRLIIDGRYYDRSGQFLSKKPWQRFLIIAGGPLFNFIMAFFLSLILTASLGADKPYVAAVEPDMPAYDTGLEKGDLITAIAIGDERASIKLSRDLQLFLYLNEDDFSEGLPVRLEYIDTEGHRKSAEFYPAYSDETESWRMGLSYSIAYMPLSGPLEVVSYSIYNVRYCLISALQSIKLVLTGGAQREDVMGPVRMVSTIDQTVDEASDYGIWMTLLTVFNIMIIISASLGVMNLLPIPALDGGRLIFILIEMVTGKGVPKEIEARIHVAGMAVLLMLMVLIMFNDISIIV